MIDLRDEYPDVRWHQGDLEPAIAARFPPDRLARELERERRKLFARPDPLYSRILLWAFDTPEECRQVADRHNATLRRP